MTARQWSEWPDEFGNPLLLRWAWVEQRERAYPWWGKRIQWRWVAGTVAFSDDYERGNARGWANTEDEAKQAVRDWVTAQNAWRHPRPKPYEGTGTW